MNPITRQMTRAYIATTGAVTRTIDRMRNNDRGQGTLEYVGIVIVIVGILAAVMAIVSKYDLAGKVETELNKFFTDGGGSTKAPAPKHT